MLTEEEKHRKLRKLGGERKLVQRTLTNVQCRERGQPVKWLDLEEVPGTKEQLLEKLFELRAMIKYIKELS